MTLVQSFTRQPITHMVLTNPPLLKWADLSLHLAQMGQLGAQTSLPETQRGLPEAQSSQTEAHMGQLKAEMSQL